MQLAVTSRPKYYKKQVPRVEPSNLNFQTAAAPLNLTSAIDSTQKVPETFFLCLRQLDFLKVVFCSWA